MYCSSCGKEAAGAFCQSCGHSLTDRSGREEESTLASARPASPYASTSKIRGAARAPNPSAGTQQKSKRSKSDFTTIAAILGVLALAAGSWFAVTQALNRPSSSPSSHGTARASGASTASADASPPSSSTNATTSDQQASDYLRRSADSTLRSIDLNAGIYVPRIATKWVGLTTSDHPSPYTASDIKSEFDNEQKRFGNVKWVLSSAVGKQAALTKSHPDAYIAYVDTHFSSAADATAWCAANMSTDKNVCAAQALNAPHS